MTTRLVCSPPQVHPHVRRELEFLLLLEELGSEGIPETLLKVFLISHVSHQTYH